MNTNVVGVDMGGTKILAAIVNAEGNILSTAKIPTQAKDDTSIGLQTVSERLFKNQASQRILFRQSASELRARLTQRQESLFLLRISDGKMYR